ncbi:hypothetical protein [Gordonia otitidis]|uniref:Uncharacterized protein n=1 Tax=Gordonia otitidis (strain DSM 44809 / CCUG 52243 / JCM 12355 / NBRC 100426 / IFM 10032) TaxID=1108044 RepID=H5TRS5_GORO1|nr:hypothetical protein [Gordonia otitidis]GAB36183.1 hypothetical protein GOOTI_202_00390 [Gordonia otitidis NBRC 100426]
MNGWNPPKSLQHTINNALHSRRSFAVSHGKDTGDHPFVSLTVRWDGHELRLTWHTRTTGTYRFFSGLAATPTTGWRDVTLAQANTLIRGEDDVNTDARLHRTTMSETSQAATPAAPTAGGHTPAIGTDCNSTPATNAGTGDEILLQTARVWQLRMLGTKRFARTIIGADISRILNTADDNHAVLQLFDDYTHHVPADIAAEVRAVLEWTPWTHRPPVHVTRDEVPDELFVAISEAAQRHRHER